MSTAAASGDAAFQLTRFVKSDGPLTKRITLGEDGRPKSDGSACIMPNGTARRVGLDSVAGLADLIARLGSDEAIALGTLRSDLPAEVTLVTKRRLEKLNGEAPADIVARTGNHILFRPGAPAFALLDFDTKGMPDAVRNRLDDLGGFAAAVRSILPDLANAGRALRMSTSSGIYRTDTGERFAGSGGMHLFVAVADGQDIQRFLDTLHARCWLAGLGWMMVGAAGQLLERSIVDRMVGAPERLVFEGAPIVAAPLAQDAESRRPEAKEGPPLDTVAACPPLTILEQSRLKELRAREAHRLAPDSAKARDAFIERAGRQGRPNAPAFRMPRRCGWSSANAPASCCRMSRCPGMTLRWAGRRLPTCSPILPGLKARPWPTRWKACEYGTCKAKIMRRADGTPWIHSFAHGRTVYPLLYDAAAIAEALAKVPADQAADLFVRLAVNADLDDDESESLRNQVAERTGVGKRAIGGKLKQAQRAKGRTGRAGSQPAPCSRAARPAAADPGTSAGRALAAADGGAQ